MKGDMYYQQEPEDIKNFWRFMAGSAIVIVVVIMAISILQSRAQEANSDYLFHCEVARYNNCTSNDPHVCEYCNNSAADIKAEIARRLAE